jgi:hypothetical protein
MASFTHTFILPLLYYLRHWEKIAEQLKVDIHPIENFTTEQIIALNLKDSLELISKIGESAAKEYQVHIHI